MNFFLHSPMSSTDWTTGSHLPLAVVWYRHDEAGRQPSHRRQGRQDLLHRFESPVGTSVPPSLPLHPAIGSSKSIIAVNSAEIELGVTALR